MSAATEKTAMTLQLTREIPIMLERKVTPECVASVIVPARNAKASLRRALESLARQVDLQGKPLYADTCEVLLLVNNWTDRTA